MLLNFHGEFWSKHVPATVNMGLEFNAIIINLIELG